MADDLNRTERVRTKYSRGPGRFSARRARDRRLSARQRLSHNVKHMEQQQLSLDPKKTMEAIVKERDETKARERIRQARERGILNPKEVEKIMLLKQAQERLRRDIQYMLKRMDRNSELQQNGFHAMKAGHVNEAIQTFGDGKNGSLGNEYAGVDSRIAEDLKKVQKTGGNKIVRQTLKDALSKAVPADSIYRREENHSQRNLEGDRTKKSTGEEIAQELTRRRLGEAYAGR